MMSITMEQVEIRPFDGIGRETCWKQPQYVSEKFSIFLFNPIFVLGLVNPVTPEINIWVSIARTIL